MQSVCRVAVGQPLSERDCEAEQWAEQGGARAQRTEASGMRGGVRQSRVSVQRDGHA
eukprot:COSAG02_NODE_37543_length_440_cov_1.583578_1_plen_56_part_10